MDIRVLGPVELYAHGRRVPLGARRQRFLLAVLALDVNRVVPIEQLIALAWPSDPPRTAVHAIRVVVSRLRAALAGVSEHGGPEPGGPAREVEICTRGAGYLLLADPMCVDAHRFLQRIELARTLVDNERRIAVLSEALDLWSGPPLSGAASPEVRDRLGQGLEEARRSARLALMDSRLAAGQHLQLLPELDRMAREHPFDERVRGQQMIALYRAGRQADALAVYRQLRRTLGVELGIDPSRPVRDLEGAILRQDPVLVLAPPAR